MTVTVRRHRAPWRALPLVSGPLIVAAAVLPLVVWLVMAPVVLLRAVVRTALSIGKRDTAAGRDPAELASLRVSARARAEEPAPTVDHPAADRARVDGEAVAALVALGYAKRDALAAVEAVRGDRPDAGAVDIVKAALALKRS